MSNTPDPGEGYRLVTDYSEEPHPMAEHWFFDKTWIRRESPEMQYKESCFYRVPIDPAAVPPIPLAEDPCSLFNEPDRLHAVVVWIIGALVFVTGFLLGWSI